jgi:glucosyl-dolichyl phosphate glucuronosyltransferase
MSFSIIIPTYNRADVLGRTLKSIVQLDSSPEDFEIFVVDNGSTDSTREVFEEARTSSPKHNWRYALETVPGLLSGRHKGILKSQGDICSLIDDDVRLDVSWLNALKESFRDPAVALVGGPSRPLFESPPPDWLEAFYVEEKQIRACGWLSLLDAGNQSREIPATYVWGLNYSVRRQTLFDAGGFHPDIIYKNLDRYHGDGETGLSLKIEKSGGKCLYHPHAAVQHEVPTSRMTHHYFLRRFYYQGLVDSFTRIREEGNVSPPTWSWKDPLRPAKRWAIGLFRHDPGGAIALQEQTYWSHRKGYDFHQSEVRRDPKLLEWILRKDYWDYALPDGWEIYLK